MLPGPKLHKAIAIANSWHPSPDRSSYGRFVWLVSLTVPPQVCQTKPAKKKETITTSCRRRVFQSLPSTILLPPPPPLPPPPIDIHQISDEFQGINIWIIASVDISARLLTALRHSTTIHPRTEQGERENRTSIAESPSKTHLHVIYQTIIHHGQCGIPSKWAGLAADPRVGRTV